MDHFVNALSEANQAVNHVNAQRMLQVVKVIHRAIEDLPSTNSEAVSLLRSELSDRLVNASDILWWLERCESTSRLKDLSFKIYGRSL